MSDINFYLVCDLRRQCSPRDPGAPVEPVRPVGPVDPARPADPGCPPVAISGGSERVVV